MMWFSRNFSRTFPRHLVDALRIEHGLKSYRRFWFSLAIHHSTLRLCSQIWIWMDMIWYDMIWYDMIWYDMIWYDMIYIIYIYIYMYVCIYIYINISYHIIGPGGTPHTLQPGDFWSSPQGSIVAMKLSRFLVVVASVMVGGMAYPESGVIKRGWEIPRGADWRWAVFMAKCGRIIMDHR